MCVGGGLGGSLAKTGMAIHLAVSSSQRCLVSQVMGGLYGRGDIMINKRYTYPLPENKILDRSNSKQIADDTLKSI